MPDWVTWGLGVIGAIGGLYTGWATIVRARGQNKNDERSQLTTEQVSYRQSLREDMAILRAQVAELDKSKDALEAISAEQGKQIAVLSRENEYQAREMRAQAEQISALHDQNGKQASQIATLTEERQQHISRLAVVTAQKDFLEREVNELRTEVQRLQGQLPPRTAKPPKEVKIDST